MSGIITNAINHLKKLEESMRQEGGSFSHEDIQNCDIIADLIQELEIEVKKLHIDLETETIKSSVFRHKLMFFENNLLKEIEENVLAARDSNMIVISKLNEELNELSKKLDILHSKDKELSQKFSTMKPEKQRLKQTYENIVILLNKNMANKAEGQIKLNETRDLLRDTNKEIGNLEEDMFTLRDNLLKEKAEAREEKKRLEEEKTIAIADAAAQEEHNLAKTKEVESIKSRFADSSKNLRQLYRDNEKLEQTIKELEAEIEAGTKTLQDLQKYLEGLIAESLRISNEDISYVETFTLAKQDLNARIKKCTEKSKSEAENLKILKEVQEKKKEELKLVFQSFKDLQVLLETSKKNQDELRMKTSKVLGDISEVEAVNEELYRTLSQAQQAHNQVIDSFMREIEELREQSQYERETRIKNQQIREDTLVEIEKFNDDTIIEQSNAVKYLNIGKEKYNSLIEKERNFSKAVAINEQEKQKLTDELNIETAAFNKMKSELEEKLGKLEKENDHYDKENTDMVNELNEISPKYQKLCKDFADKTREHNDHRQLLIKAKNRKNLVEDNITKIQAQIINNDKSRDKNNALIVEKRNLTMKQMKDSNNEVKQLETEILDIGLKTQTLKEQNDKFIQAIQNIELEFKSIENEVNESEQDEKSLRKEYYRLNMDLVFGWSEDEELTKIFADKDLVIIEKLKDILDKTKERERGINYVSDRIFKEVEGLDEYLNIMIGNIEE